MKKSVITFVGFLTIASVFGQFKAEVTNVHLPLLIFDNGKLVILAKENFRVFEGEKEKNGKIIWIEQEIENFSRYDDQGIALAVASDSSESMASVFKDGITWQESKLERARNAAKALFKAVFREGKDRGLVSEIFYEFNRLDLKILRDVLGFVPTKTNKVFFYKNAYHYFLGNVRINGNVWVLTSTSLFVDQDWTGKLEDIEIGVSKIKESGGATPLRDAVFNLAKHFLLVDRNLFRVAVVLTDGRDIPDPEFEQTGKIKVNAHQLKEVITELQNNQVLVYTVGLYSRPSLLSGPDPESDFLEELATATGGLAFFETDLSKLDRIFRQIEVAIRNINFVSYIPKSTKDGERFLRVETGEWDAQGEWHKKNYTLFHRKGYFYKKQP